MITLIGTGHVFDLSQAILDILENRQPDVIGVELDRQRLNGLILKKNNPEKFTETRKNVPIIYKFLAHFQDNMADEYGVIAGDEMITAKLEEELAVFRELSGFAYTTLPVSASTGAGLGRIGPELFQRLGVVRVYTKTPGRPADLAKPFTLRQGQTVNDLAMLVHRDIAAGLKYARLWGQGSFNGQQVGREHPLADRDILELHT